MKGKILPQHQKAPDFSLGMNGEFRGFRCGVSPPVSERKPRTLVRGGLLSILILIFSFVFFPAGSVLGAIKNPLPTITPTPSPTVEYVLPYPGILPDNPLYFLKVIRDRILLIFTSDPVKKIQLNLLLSDKRLVMGQLLWEKGKFELGIDTITKGEKYLLLSAVGIVELGKVGNPPPGLSDKVGLAAKKHIEIIAKIISLTGDETYQKRLNDALGITHQAIQQIAPSS